MDVKHTASLLTKRQKITLQAKQRILKKEVRAQERALKKVRERYLLTFIPTLTSYLDEQFEIYKNEQFGGGVGRFDVAQAFTVAGIKMDFRLAEALLEYASKKRKAYLIAEGGQGNDAYYGSNALLKKYQQKK